MTRRIAMTLAAALLAASAVGAQTSRASVSAAEVNGTFRHNFTGKYRGSSNEIRILALGKGKLKVAFDLVYPYTDSTGELTANLGMATGTADIIGDTAVYRSAEDEECMITIKFVKPGLINVEQEGGCGFGHNVTAAGQYRRTSAAKPKFESHY